MTPSELIPNGLLEEVSVEKGSSRATCSETQANGIGDPFYLLNSENVLQEYLLQPPIKAIDDHLVEFSEAMRTVAKALRGVAEEKAMAKAEAEEWKRKYFLRERAEKTEAEEWKRKYFLLERAHNLQLNSNDSTLDGIQFNSKGQNSIDASTQSIVHEPFERCCGQHGICSDEVLRNETIESLNEGVCNMDLAKASFKLSWGCNGEKNGRYKHAIVSFERGNITTLARSSKQISLTWESPPQTILILTKPKSDTVRALCSEMIRWLKDHKKINIFVEPRVKGELLAESSFFNFVQTWKDDEEILLLHSKVDLVVTLGGDGTVLWAASIFKGPVPPVVSFSLGSLGFMTPFHSEQYREYLDAVLKGPISITLRHRLQCHVVRHAAKHELDTEEDILVLNEVTIDRGMSSYLTQLECYCDDSFVTCVQGDGLILSTTSGSTAYNLAAGGSMVQPQVPGILFTPICPHSLSFRPLILPECVTLRVLVPFNSRGEEVWASFDGKGRKKLAAGDALICTMAPWPVPTACQVDSISDFLHSIHEGLHWNLRKTQSFDGPRDS